MYAIVDIKGKQFKAEKGASLVVPSISAAAGDKLEFDTVMMIRDEKSTVLGSPYVSGARVSATVESHGKEPKLTIYRYKRRKDSHRKLGHRQGFTVLKVEDISAGS